MLSALSSVQLPRCGGSMPHTLLALLFVLVAMSDVVTCEPHQNKMADRSSIFEIIRSNIGSLGTVEMHNAARGEKVVIVTDYGGRIEELKLLSQSTGSVRDVLLSHNGNATAIMENVWWKGMLLLPYANRIAYGKYQFWGTSYNLPVNENTTDRMNALHGFMAGRTPLSIEEELNPLTNAAITATYLVNDEPGYPFKLVVAVTYNLTMEGFTITARATNKNGDGTPLPFYMGWHPYFKCTPYSSVITLDPCTGWNHMLMNSNLNPTGITEPTTVFDGSTPIGGLPGKPTQYDTEFKPLNGSAVCPILVTKLRDVATGQTVVLWQDERFRFAQVFTGYSPTSSEDEAVAIEPMSGMADAFNNHDHLTVLSDGETWQGSFGVYVE